MNKLLCSFLCCVLIALSAIADASDGEPNNTTPGDYQFISVYELTSMNDTTASYTARSALYYPMGRVVVAGGGRIMRLKTIPAIIKRRSHLETFST